MSILKTPTNPTKESNQRKVAEQILELAAHTHRQTVSQQNDGISILWNNYMGLTPQEVCDALGTDAAKIFRMHSLLTTYLVAVAEVDGISAEVSVPTNAFTANSDGTVTILDTPYQKTDV